jgi:polar amino acid transport system substrate-binding protein
MQIQSSVNSRSPRSKLASRVTAALSVGLVVTALPASAAGTLERIQKSGHISLGYLADARPFSTGAEGSKPEGFSIALCEKVVERVKAQLSLPQLAIDWVPVTAKGDLAKVREGAIDLMCTPAAETLSRRQDVSFSIPVFPAGMRAVLRKDAAAALRDALANTPGAKSSNAAPVWRGAPAAKLLEKKTFAVVAGSTSESWLAGKISMFQMTKAQTVLVPDYRTGLQQLADRKVDVFFGDRAVMLGAMDSAQRQNLTVLDRMLTHEPVSLALARGDDEFRLTVDSALSATYTATNFGELFAKWFGEYDESARTFYTWTAIQQ